MKTGRTEKPSAELLPGSGTQLDGSGKNVGISVVCREFGGIGKMLLLSGSSVELVVPVTLLGPKVLPDSVDGE